MMNLSDYATSTLLRIRTRIAQAALSLLGGLSFTLALLVFSGALTPEQRQLALIPLLFSMLAFGLLLALRNRRYTLAVLNITGIYLALATYNFDFETVTLFLMVTLALLVSAMIVDRTSFFVVMAIIAVRLGLYIASLDDGTRNLGALVGGFMLSAFPLTLAVVVRIFSNTLQRTASDAQRTADLLEASANIGQVMSKMLDSDQLLARAVEIIRDRFGFYHVQIFLVDEAQRYAYLTASTGEVGQKLLAREHRLPVDARSVIGRVVQAAEPVVAGDALRETGYAYNELLPNTRSELALPISDADTIIGALDVQSTRPNAFTPTQIQALQVMANQLAIAIRNARLFEEQDRNVRENKRLFVESETNLREIQRLNRQLTRRAWEDYLTGAEAIDGVTLSGSEFRPGAAWSPQMVQAAQRRRVLIEPEDDRQLIAVPIEIRGEVVGAMEIEVNAETDANRIADMLRAIAQRLGISLDNARLFEETQETTAQEQRIGDIATQYQQASTVDDLLQVTLRGLAEALSADEGAIRLGRLPAANGTDALPDNTPADHNGAAT